MKSSNKLLAVAVMLIAMLALVACQSAAPVEDVPEIVVPVAAAPVEAPAPAPAPAPVEEAPAVEPITGTLSAYGYSVSYSAVPGSATVTYPADVIYEEDIAAFAQYIYAGHADLLDGVYFEVSTPGTLVITFPEAVTVADGQAVINMLAPELDSFIASYLN